MIGLKHRRHHRHPRMRMMIIADSDVRCMNLRIQSEYMLRCTPALVKVLLSQSCSCRLTLMIVLGLSRADAPRGFRHDVLGLKLTGKFILAQTRHIITFARCPDGPHPARNSALALALAPTQSRPRSNMISTSVCNRIVINCNRIVEYHIILGNNMYYLVGSVKQTRCSSCRRS